MFDIGFKRYAVTLSLERSIRLQFNHGGALSGLLRAAMGSHEVPGLIPFACESGRVRFEAGDSYRFVITLVGAATGSVYTLVAGLGKIGARSVPPAMPAPTFGGNFEVASVEPLPEPDLAGELRSIASSKELSLRFHSPFRLKRPEELQIPHAAYVNQECFPADHFLRRLWNRLLYLERGRYPSREELLTEPPPPTGSVASRSAELAWIDVPVPGAPGKHKEQPKGFTLGGVQGTIQFEGVPEHWTPLLVAGQYLHAGEKAQFGFGRYQVIETRTDHWDSLRPARTAVPHERSRAGVVWGPGVGEA